jgi:hypothetical protein
MGSSLSLNDRIRFLLPQAGRCGHEAAVTLVQAMLLTFTTVLTDLARKTGRNCRTQITRTWLARWLARDRWDPEAEFRDIKGPLGLDRLAGWEGREAVARLLAMVAIYEWRLAYLWLSHRLWEWRRFFQVKGELSWITITRLWIQHQLLPLIQPALACL